MIDNKSSVLIIGGGLGGLFTGAILATEGMLVTVLEKNATIGGGLQTFRRFGVEFDTGMHTIVGMRQGGNIRRLCEYLGIADKMDVLDVDDQCCDRLYFDEDATVYEIANGKDGFVDSLARHYPAERTNLVRYVEAVFRMTDLVNILHLRPSDSSVSLFSFSDEFMLAADAFIAKYIDDQRLRSVLAYLCPLYGGIGGKTPAYIHAILTRLYIEGASRFVGGSRQFADLLAGVITAHGGEIHTSDGVEWVEVNDRHVDFVRTQSGKEFSADCYVSAIHPCALLDRMPEKAFPPSFRSRIRSVPNSYSAFCLFVKLKEGRFPYMNFSEYYLRKYDDIWKFNEPQPNWPNGLLFMTPPEIGQGAFATKVIITAPMLFSEAERWTGTTVGRRGDDYLRWKEEQTRRLLAVAEKMHPGFADCIEAVNAASPLTIRDFYATKEGSLYGFSKDCNNIALSQLPVVTKVRNLYLTGQNNSLHGFCGVPLTAINTCEAILGVNTIVNQLSE